MFSTDKVNINDKVGTISSDKVGDLILLVPKTTLILFPLHKFCSGYTIRYFYKILFFWYLFV